MEPFLFYTMEKLKNLGPYSMKLLTSIGISTREELKSWGAVRAYTVLKFQNPEMVSLHLLYSLEGAIRGIDYRALTKEEKQRLRAEWENSNNEI